MTEVMNPLLPSYQSYKDSGVPWVGKVPEHWEALRLKHWIGINESVLSESTDPGFEFRYMEISAVDHGRLIEFPQKTHFEVAPSRARRRVKLGDTLVSTVRTYLKAIWYAENPGDDLVCSTGFAVLTPRQGTNPKYVSYLAQSEPFTDRITAESVGTAYPAISKNKLASFEVRVPPTDEQAAIVRYLDDAGQRIRAYVSAKERLIALLEEERQAIIHQAVTRGLDPDVKLKPSRVEWLGDVPEHWDVIPIKFLCRRIQNGATPPTDVARYYENGEIPWYGPSSWTSQGQLSSPVCYLSASAFNEGKARLIYEPALLVVVIGTTGRMSLLLQDASTNQQITAFELDVTKIHPSFLFHQVQHAEDWLRLTAPSSTLPILDSYTIARLGTAVPSVVEQVAIAEHVSGATHDISLDINRARRQVELMEEYRTRLIADVVTGKIDVRGTRAEPSDDLLTCSTIARKIIA